MALDVDGYPTRESLNKLKNYDLMHRPASEFLELLAETWKWGIDLKGRHLRLATGGWSGNEETMEYLNKNFMFNMCWVSSHRGGLHIYHFSKDMFPDMTKPSMKREAKSNVAPNVAKV